MLKRSKYIVSQAASGVIMAIMLSSCANSHQADSKLSLAATGNVMPAAEVAQRYHADQQWWLVYQDDKLNALLEQALANNINLKQAALNVNKALYQANILGANLVPSFNGSFGASTSQNLKNGGNTNNFSSQLGLSYELDLWKKVSAQADAKVWEYQATAQDLAASRLALINNITDAYFNIAYLNEAITLSNKNLTQYQEINRIAAAKYKYGKVSANEATQAQQNVLSAQNNLLVLQTNRENLEQVLRNLLNLKPAEAIAAVTENYTLGVHVPVNLDIPISVLANRPDLLAAEYRLQSAMRNLDAQKRSWYPKITLGASLSSASSKAKTMFDIPFLGGSASISLPFLDWQTLKWENKTSEANFESAKLNFEQTLTTALNEVNTFYRQYQLSGQTLANARQKNLFDQKNSRYHSARYKYGKSELKNWLEALNTVHCSAQTVLNQRYEILKYENMIYKAMAGRYTPQ